MKRYLPIVLISTLLVAAIAVAVWFMRPAKPITISTLPDFDYAAPESWAVRPETPPPAVWEAGWDIDAVIISTGASIETGAAETEERRLLAAAKSLGTLSEVFASIGPVYAPLVRAGNAEADIAAALQHYIEEDNRGRAFVIATDTALPAFLAEMLAADSLLRDRFVGVLTFGETPDSAGFAPGTNKADVCSRKFEREEGCTLAIELRKSGTNYSYSGEGTPGGALTSGFTNWLHDNASKLAEPLGDLEEVEIVEIQTAPEGQ